MPSRILKNPENPIDNPLQSWKILWNWQRCMIVNQIMMWFIHGILQNKTDPPWDENKWKRVIYYSTTSTWCQIEPGSILIRRILDTFSNDCRDPEYFFLKKNLNNCLEYLKILKKFPSIIHDDLCESSKMSSRILKKSSKILKIPTKNFKNRKNPEISITILKNPRKCRQESWKSHRKS